jgi:succinoglycan biosynthesis protein ExoV
MKLHFWNGPNFGDQLNEYIFPKLLPELLNSEPDDTILFGIGSILHDNLMPNAKKAIVFGSGMRNPMPVKEAANLDIRFLRGPLSANCLWHPDKYITDAAYLLTLIDEFNALLSLTTKKHKASLIPYFAYAERLPWARICSQIGINYISPSSPTTEIILEILGSEHVIAGAMHGAIVADICRVPWVRLRMDQYPTEDLLTTEFKWTDWMLSLGLKTDHHVKISSADFYNSDKMHSKLLFALEMIVKLRDRSRVTYQLASDKILASKRIQLADAIDSLRADFDTEDRTNR